MNTCIVVIHKGNEQVQCDIPFIPYPGKCPHVCVLLDDAKDAISIAYSYAMISNRPDEGHAWALHAHTRPIILLVHLQLCPSAPCTVTL